MSTVRIGILLAVATMRLFVSDCVAQPDISSAGAWAWNENCGWTNWYEAGSPAGAQRVCIQAECLSGFAWGENIGWINMGNGMPTNGRTYSNTNGRDFGVNLAPSGQLYGLAWGENIGWINFAGGALATPPRPALLDAPAGRLRGFVWGENVGWINLDDSTKFVALRCPADFDDGSGTGNPDGGVTIDDLIYYLRGYSEGNPAFDLTDGLGACHRDGGVTIDDLLFFLLRYADGC